MKIELSKSYKVAGHDVKEIELDLESLTGTELLACEKEFKLKNKDSFFKEGEDGYALVVASKASNVRYHEFLEFRAIDFLKVINSTKTFLAKGWESKDPAEEEEVVVPVAPVVEKTKSI